MTFRQGSVGQPSGRGRCGGAALLDLLVATGVALAVLAVVSASLPPVLDVVRAVPEATDLQQRARATEVILGGLLRNAGAGADLLGVGPLSRAVPGVIPRRVLGSADPAGTAWADRLSLLRAEVRAAQAPVAAAVPAGSDSVPLIWHPACGMHVSCGFRRGDVVLVSARSGAMTIASLADVTGLVLTLAAPTDQTLDLPATAAVVRVHTLSLDPGRRQLRLADTAAPAQPLTDEVVGFAVRYYGSPAAPRWPAIAGAETCTVAADGTPRLPRLGPVPGPPVELSVAELADGPWCGSGAWRFDADLMRIRAARFAIRLQAGSAGVRGVAPQWFARPGLARRPGEEVRDVQLDTFITIPNLAWTQ